MFCRKKNYEKLLYNNTEKLFELFLDLLINKSVQNKQQFCSRFTSDNLRIIAILSFETLEDEEYRDENILKIIAKIDSWDIRGINKLKENPIIIYNLSQLYFTDDLIKNSAKGLKWMKEAAYLGDAIASFELGSFYRAGCKEFGIEQNISQAIVFLENGAQLDDIECIRALAHIYNTGEKGLIPIDIYRAEEWYKYGANLKDAVSLCNLAYLYESNDCFGKNIFEIKSLYVQAAELESTKAMLYLSRLIICGKLGGNELENESSYISLLSRAVDLGDEEAEKFLNLYYSANIIFDY